MSAPTTPPRAPEGPPPARQRGGARVRWPIVVPLGIVIGVALTLALWSRSDRDPAGRDSSSSSSSSAVSDAPLVDVGAPVDPAAVWLFGFDSVRVDPSGTGGSHRLGRPAFGNVLSAPASGAVYMYDARSGRVGRLDARTNRIVEGPRLARWAAPGRESMATTTRMLWLVTGPGEVTGLDARTLAVRARAGLGAAATRTWVASAGQGTFALTDTGAELAVARLGEDGSVGAPTSIPGDGDAGAAVALASSTDTLWVVRERAVTALRSSDVGFERTVSMGSGLAPLHGAATTGTDIWLLADDSNLYRITPGSDAAARVAVVDAARPFREPASLASGRGGLWVIVPVGDPRAHAADVVRVHPATGKILYTLHVPSSLFAGAIAVS